MSNDNIQQRFQGESLCLVHCVGAAKSFTEAMSHFRPNKIASFKRAMEAQMRRFVDGHRMSKENFCKEGPLPHRVGQNGTKNFYAFKKIPIRAYGWYSETKPNTFFVSHYVYKNFDDLRDSDVNIVGRNWIRIEVEGNEF